MKLIILTTLSLAMFTLLAGSVRLGQINFCEKFFLKCDVNENKLSKKDDCDYFHEHRCQYYIGKVEKYLHPMLFRQDVEANTTFTLLAMNKSLPTYGCISMRHLQKRFPTDNSTIPALRSPERREQFLAIMPRRAVPLGLFNHTRYVDIVKTDINGFWSLEDRSEFSEFVYVYENTVKCGKTKQMAVPLKHSHRHMMISEFGKDIENIDNLKMMTLFVIKGSKKDSKCARIDPLYVSDHDKTINQLTYVLPAEVYPHSFRIYDKDNSQSPFVGELGAQPSAWCRSNRVIMGLSNAVLRRSGQDTQFVGAYYCSLFVGDRKRAIRLTFKHLDEAYVVKVLLRAVPSGAQWSPLSIELNRKTGHAILGPAVNLKFGRRHSFQTNDTYYSVEQELVIGDERLQLIIGRLGINFCDTYMGLQINDFTKKYDPLDDTSSSEEDFATPETPSNYTGPPTSSATESTVSSMPGEESGSCTCAPDEDGNPVDCDCAGGSATTKSPADCDCRLNNPQDMLQSQNSCECTLILGK